MNRQKEIRAEVELMYCLECPRDNCDRLSFDVNTKKDKTKGCMSSMGFIDRTFRYLDSKGVVIKDKRYGMGMDTRGGYTWKDVFFVEPLIETCKKED